MIPLFPRLNKFVSRVSLPVTYVFLIVIGLNLLLLAFWLVKTISHYAYLDQIASVAGRVSSPFLYTFNTPGVLEESGEMYESISPYWWLNSGGFLIINSNIGQTIQGELSSSNKWQQLYQKNNPLDTDGGQHPQNIFRLVTRSTWQDFTQEVYLKINRVIASNSPNRNESNGLLLFSHYVDGNNLYYAGLRVDGKAVIKKKTAGRYYTLSEKQVFNNKVYNRASNPNLLPLNTWLGIRTEVKNLTLDKVEIKLYLDLNRTSKWELVTQVIDDAKSFGGPAITQKGFAGIRTDFMDVDFSNYQAEEHA